MSGQITQPRLLGDGMDSEAMKRQPTLQMAPPLGRHKNLNTSESSTSVARSASKKFLPHEPVKGAVKAVTTSSLPVAQLSTLPLSAAQLSGSQLPGSQLPASTTSSVVSPVSRNQPGELQSVIVAMSDDSREVEGQPQVARQDDVGDDINSLKQQLVMQTKVNEDLKNMLVASVGDDLHYKMESLARTKAVLQCELGDYTRKVSEDYENLDQLSIQADLWRSKFVATRLLSDKLTVEKKKEHEKRREAETALQLLMQEREQLNAEMVSTHRYLKLLRDSFNPTCASKIPPTIATSLDLAHTNLQLSESIKFRLLGGMPMLEAALDAGIKNGLSPAEQLAWKALRSVDRETKTETQTVADSTLYSRFHPRVRYDNITFNCCTKCNGDIKVV